MERLDKLAEYFREKDRKKLNATTMSKWEIGGLPDMTPDEIRLTCLENNGYDTPELNDKLYLHFRGFKKIQNLEPYTGCKALWLDSNGFEVIENLDTMVELRCLYLSKNLISRIDGLSHLSNLVLLDLSNNRVTKIENLSGCPLLQTLNLSRNYLSSADSIVELSFCENLINLDITNNKLPQEELVVENLSKIPMLSNLSMGGNETCRLPSFRKKMIYSMPKLGYLDRPVEELERIGAKAFIEGGADAETAARDAYRQAKQDERKNEMAKFRAWQKEQSEIRAKAREVGDTSGFLSPMSQEEIDNRALEAKKAAEEEKFLAQEGNLSKLAAHFWRMGGDSNKDRDILAEAMEAVRRENEQEALANLDDIQLEVTEAAPSIAVNQEEKLEPVGTEMVKDVPDHATEICTSSSSSSSQLPTQIAVTESADSEDNYGDAVIEPVEQQASTEQDLELQRARELERQEEDLRNQRIAESLAIYRQQRLEEQAGKKVAMVGSSTFSMGNNMTVYQKEENVVRGSDNLSQYTFIAPDQLYWTEKMDLELASLVRQTQFNFPVIASHLLDLAMNGSFGLSTQQHPALITEESCRIRWSQLDANRWSQVSPDATVLETIYKVCVQPEILGKGHGAQPSFQALSSLASSSFPSYLRPPTSFPSVADLSDEEDDDVDEDEDEDENERSNAGQSEFDVRKKAETEAAHQFEWKEEFSSHDVLETSFSSVVFSEPGSDLDTSLTDLE